MSKPELDTLLELKQNPSLTQRSLAHRLNISLGLTNAILKNLILRGWMKAQKLTGRKFIYLITPDGIAQATHLAYIRFQETQNYYHNIKNRLSGKFTKFYNEGKQEAIIYGVNQLSEITFLALLDSPLKLCYFSIINDDLSKKRFLGYQVFSISDFIKKYSQNPFPPPEKLVILATTKTEKLNQKIKEYKNIYKNINIVNVKNILKYVLR